ncbi:MAG: S9 family peptidase, partial [Gammaproteobacteria bacterium]|nr:S9 family peptidase [Gammaproteobacteria bacterium]
MERDGKSIIVAGNHREDWEYAPADTELFRVDPSTGESVALTQREGPDYAPTLSPDGRTLAYLGYDDDGRSYVSAAVYVMDLGSGKSRRLSPPMPGSVDTVRWSRDGKRMYVMYDVEGDTRIAELDLEGRLTDVIDGVGGLDLSRPYSAGAFEVGGDLIAFTQGTPTRPADLAVRRGNAKPLHLTHLNDDLLGHRDIDAPEEIWFDSPADGKRIQAWVIKPPGFDANRRYPLILEIHGGPHTNYGPRFAAELQLFAAAGYVVVYANPRGSTSYGEGFANLIDKQFPSQDYDDL